MIRIFTDKSAMSRRQPVSSRVATTLVRFFGGEAGAGTLLIAVAIAAVLIANSSLAHSYHALFHAPLGWTPITRLDTVHSWINDALMALFFFVVGLEIKREVLAGELSSPARRRLPIFAAMAGMAVPATIYLAIAGTQLPLQRGWAIPAATDIAFAVGVLALLGKRIPPSIRLFLLAVAIIDDLGAIAIIALFYTADIDPVWLAGAAGALMALFALGRSRVERTTPYLLLAAVLWFCVLHSGIHATIAGVLAALAIPLRLGSAGDSMLLRLEHALAPWSAYLIVPLFGFANAGVALSAGAATDLAGLPLAVAAGLFFGKQFGVLGAIALADKAGFAPRPTGASWVQLWGMAMLCGIGFTMSLFIGGLAFPAHPLLVDEAKLGVLAGSLASALAGYAILRLAPRPRS
jgi:NhaA family Na+:H+ antiporter